MYLSNGSIRIILMPLKTHPDGDFTLLLPPFWLPHSSWLEFSRGSEQNVRKFHVNPKDLQNFEYRPSQKRPGPITKTDQWEKGCTNLQSANTETRTYNPNHSHSMTTKRTILPSIIKLYFSHLLFRKSIKTPGYHRDIFCPPALLKMLCKDESVIFGKKISHQFFWLFEILNFSDFLQNLNLDEKNTISKKKTVSFDMHSTANLLQFHLKFSNSEWLDIWHFQFASKR